MKYIGIMTATYWEAKSLIQSLGLNKISKNHYRKTYANSSIELLISGMGPLRAKEAAQTLLQFPPSFVLLTGFAGSLSENLPAGGIALDSKRSDSLLAEKISTIAREKNIPLSCGTFFCTEKMLSTSEEKIECGIRTKAIACEMESDSVFSVLQQNHIPLCSVRGISDSVDETLPSALKSIDSSGTLSLKFFINLLTHPKDWIKFWRLSRACRRSQKLLNSVLITFIQRETGHASL